MMKQNEHKRIYKHNGMQMVFNPTGLQSAITTKHRERNITKTALMEELAMKMGISVETIRGWHKGKNGPIDYATVESLADALGLSDISILVITNDGGNEMVQLTERQKAAAKRIYDICIWFLSEFYHSNGFNDYWLKFKDAGSQDPESDIYDMVEGFMNKVNLVLDQEYFDLHDCDIYDELSEFVSQYLYNTYDGKISYSYRFEAIPNGNPTTSEDYEKAMTKLNTIACKYV